MYLGWCGEAGTGGRVVPEMGAATTAGETEDRDLEKGHVLVSSLFPLSQGCVCRPVFTTLGRHPIVAYKNIWEPKMFEQTTHHFKAHHLFNFFYLTSIFLSYLTYLLCN